ncbi:hypothetical protein ACHHYP_10596, partial [Achlya hypogyna]
FPSPTSPQPASSLRPIVLQNSIRKAISLLVVRRLSPKVESYVGPYQSGFRRQRSTTDTVWPHKWLIARMHRYYKTFTVLGIDISPAFDTIDRVKLQSVLPEITTLDDVRLVKMLLTKTTLAARHDNYIGTPFETNTGTPQGEALSPVMFIVYLEAALRDRPRPTSPPAQRWAYADDVDFVLKDTAEVDRLKSHALVALTEWFLVIDPEKTELNTLKRAHRSRLVAPGIDGVDDQEQWRKTNKLGSLLGDREDVTRRKILARAAFHNMWSLSRHGCDFTTATCYLCCSTTAASALTKGELEQLESFHGGQLRMLIGIRYSHRISNKALYDRCTVEPLRYRVLRARWGLFGHIMRCPADIPEYRAIVQYFSFSLTAPCLRRPPMSLLRVLHDDLQRLPPSPATPPNLKNLGDLERLRSFATNKTLWKVLTESIVDTCPPPSQSVA